MPTVQELEQELDTLIDGYEDLTEQAKGFGLRVAAYPKGLMPLAKALQIVKDMTAKVQAVQAFETRLQFITFDFERQQRITVPQQVIKEHKALLAKTSRILKKMEADLGKAEKAIEKYEELLLGANFQSWFEMVRMAVINLDIPEGVYLDFSSELHLDKNPPYASGTIVLEKGRKAFYKVLVGYRAKDDLYWGNIYVVSRGKTFQNVVKTSGRRGLRGDAKVLVDQLLALVHTDQQEGLFGTRKKVDLDIQDPDIIGKQVTAAVVAGVQKRWPWEGKSITSSATLHMDSGIQTGRGKVVVNETFRKQQRGLRSFFDNATKVFTRLEKGFIVEVGPDKWKVALTPYSGGFLVPVKDRGGRWGEAFYPTGGMALANMTILEGALQKVHIRKTWSVSVTKVRRRKRSSENSLTRVATRYLTAGGCYNSELVWDPNVRSAFRAAREEQGDEHGRRGYSGGLYEKESYEILQKEPVAYAELDAVARRYESHVSDKWGPAGAIPVLSAHPTKKETVTVDVQARNERDALRKGGLMIRATGRIPPNVRIQVQGMKAKVKPDSGKRVKTYVVTGERQFYKRGIAGWYFFGWCSC